MGILANGIISLTVMPKTKPPGFPAVFDNATLSPDFFGIYQTVMHLSVPSTPHSFATTKLGDWILTCFDE